MEGEKTFKKKTLELINNLKDQIKQLEETLTAVEKPEIIHEAETEMPDK